MNAEDPDAIRIFGEALGLTLPAERAVYLEQACAGNAALRQEVESLLGAPTHLKLWAAWPNNREGNSPPISAGE